LNRGETAARFFAKSGLYLKFFQKNKVVSIAGHKKRNPKPGRIRGKDDSRPTGCDGKKRGQKGFMVSRLQISIVSASGFPAGVGPSGSPFGSLPVGGAVWGRK
jgi:hypothetical protein